MSHNKLFIDQIDVLCHISNVITGAILTVRLIELFQLSDDAIAIGAKINEDQTLNRSLEKFIISLRPMSFKEIFTTLGMIEDE